MAITRSNAKKTTPSRMIGNRRIPGTPLRRVGNRRIPLASSRTGGRRNLLGAFTAADTPRTPVRGSPVLRGPPALLRAKGTKVTRRLDGRILFIETPRKMTPSALLAPHAPLKAAPETPIAWIKRMGKIWDSVMLPLTK